MERLQVVRDTLSEYRAARSFILKGGQSYSLSDNGMTRTVTQASLHEINTQIAALEREERALSASISGRTTGVYRAV